MYSPKQEVGQFSHASRYATMDTSALTHLGSSKQVLIFHFTEMLDYFLTALWSGKSLHFSLYMYYVSVLHEPLMLNGCSLCSRQCPLQAWWMNTLMWELPRQLSNRRAWHLLFSVTLVTSQLREPKGAALPQNWKTDLYITPLRHSRYKHKLLELVMTMKYLAEGFPPICIGWWNLWYCIYCTL